MSAIYEYGKRKEQKGIEKGRKEGIKEGKKEGKKEGIKEGKKEGIKEGKEEIILKLYESGMTPEEISKRLKTDLEKIKKIINK